MNIAFNQIKGAGSALSVITDKAYPSGQDKQRVVSPEHDPVLASHSYNRPIEAQQKGITLTYLVQQ